MKETTGDVIAVGFLAAVGLIAIVAIDAWIIMLVFGGLHSEISESIPAISYVGGLVLSIVLALLGATLRNLRR